MGPEICDLARGYDPRPVVSERDNKSISSETTFEDLISPDHRADIVAILTGLAEEVAHAVQAEGLLARCVAVKIRTADFRTQTRQRTLLTPTAHPAVFGRAAVAEFRRWLAERAAGGARGPARLRLLGVRASDFLGADESRQLGLFERLYSN